MSRERFLRPLDAAEYLPRRRHPDPHIRVVDLPNGSKYAARGASARPGRDIDDAVQFEKEAGRRTDTERCARRVELT